jgi:hypothetical protein
VYNRQRNSDPESRTQGNLRRKEANRKTREQLQIWVVEYLMEHPCVDCGETDPVVLDFDHVRGDKVENVAHMVDKAYCKSTIETEIAKCEVRCSNCHRRRTAKLFGWKRLALARAA